MRKDCFPPPKFVLGRCYITRNATALLTDSDVLLAIGRHQNCDWGELTEYDCKLNERAIQSGRRLVSIYHSAKGVKFYIITEAGHTTTTVLLPEDY